MKVGDVVRFRSGGPLMTVSAARETGRVDLVWFGADGVSRSGHDLPGGALEVADAPTLEWRERATICSRFLRDLKAAVNRDEKPAFLMNYLIRATAYVDGWTLTGEGEP